jgi:hypothetical protein
MAEILLGQLPGGEFLASEVYEEGRTKMANSLKDRTRRDFDEEKSVTWEGLKTGCLMRIADALERLAIDKTEVETQKELETAKKESASWLRAYATRAAELDHLYRRINSLRGVITRLNKKV